MGEIGYYFLNQANRLLVMKEALYYRVKGDVVICELCPHMCRLKAGETGLCKTRIARNNRLYTLAYGNPCALHVDPVEKKPLYHFLPGTSTFSLATNGCNLACLNCQNSSISQVSPVSENKIKPDDLISMAIQRGCKSISYTYTDPTAYYEYALDTARIARQHGLRNIMVSAGFINRKPLVELTHFMDAANIDLKCFDDAVYQKLCGARLKPVLDTLQTLKEAGVWLEITNLIIPGFTDDLNRIHQMIDWLLHNGYASVPIHFNRFIPSHRLTHLPATPESTLQGIAESAKSKGMQHVYIGNVAGHPYANSYCAQCGLELISRSHYYIEETGSVKGKCSICGWQLPGVWV